MTLEKLYFFFLVIINYSKRNEYYRNQTILAFWAPKLKIAQLFLTFTLLRTFLSKCRIFIQFAAIYPVITNRTVFKKRYKRLLLKVCIFISFSQKTNSSNSHVDNHSDWHCIRCFHVSNYNASRAYLRQH